MNGKNALFTVGHGGNWPNPTFRSGAAGLLRRAAWTAAISGLLLASAAAGVAQAAPFSAAARHSPNPGKFNNLTGVAALTPSNAWAVGTYCVAPCSYASAQTTRGMIVHWNGKMWSRVRSPNPGTNDLLNGVTAISRTDIWAAGLYSGRSSSGPLLLHWNGRKWSQVKTNFASFANVSSISASSAKNIWAVGYGSAPKANALHTEIIRWNGSAWKKVPSPNPGKQLDLLLSVSAASSSNAWAVGQYCSSACGKSSAILHGFALHWNGRKWSKVRLSVRNVMLLSGVYAISAKDAWAVGQVKESHNRGGPLLLHWNGKKWSKVSAANTLPLALAFSSASHGWAVGFGGFLHWNGHRRSRVRVRAPVTSVFDGASTDRGSDAWAVGSYCAAKCNGLRPVVRTITVHWNGKTWTRK